MKKMLSLFMVPTVFLMMGATAFAEETPEGADLVATILSYLPESWGGWVTLVIAICAGVCAVLPAPSDSSNAFYKFVYKAINAIGFNFGKAKNETK